MKIKRTRKGNIKVILTDSEQATLSFPLYAAGGCGATPLIPHSGGAYPYNYAETKLIRELYDGLSQVT